MPIIIRSSKFTPTAKVSLAFAVAVSVSGALNCAFVARAQETAAPTVAMPETASIVVSAEVAGRTPARIGYVLGDDLPGSNVSSWLRYNQISCARFWWPSSVWPAPPPAWQGANDLARFDAAREVFRRDIQTQIDWKAYGERVAQAYGGKPKGTLGDAFVLSELTKMGAAPLLVLSFPREKLPFDTATGEPDWFGRWTYWRGVYTNAYYLAHTYGAERFQLFNEPDHPESITLQQSDYIRRLQIGSDAIQAALFDVNRRDGKTLRAQISAPVTAGLVVFEPRTGRKDTRDTTVGWGELAMGTRNQDFPGRGPYNQGTFSVYAFQNYTRTAASVSKGLTQLCGLIAKANGGQELPTIASEMNVSTAADLAKTDSTLDTPKYYAAFGAIAAAYANAGLSESYIFRLTQTNNLANGTIKKNGVYVIDNQDPLKNIRYGTKTSESARLFMRGFNGGRVRFAPPTTAAADLYAVGARDDVSGTYSLMVSNLGAARTANIDLSAWKLPPGALVMGEEVSEAHFGDIAAVKPLPANGQMAVPMAENSVVLFTICPELSAKSRVMALTIQKNTIEHVAMMVPSERIGAESRTILVVGGQRVKPATAVPQMRVYGSSGPLAGAEVLGHFVPGATSGEWMVDVTRFTRGAANGNFTFRVVPADPVAPLDSFQVQSAELRVFGRR